MVLIFKCNVIMKNLISVQQIQNVYQNWASNCFHDYDIIYSDDENFKEQELSYGYMIIVDFKKEFNNDIEAELDQYKTELRFLISDLIKEIKNHTEYETFNMSIGFGKELVLQNNFKNILLFNEIDRNISTKINLFAFKDNLMQCIYKLYIKEFEKGLLSICIEYIK